MLSRLLLIALMAIALTLGLLPAAAWAQTCRTVDGHEMCLETIQRSAKYHWQYRVKASVDGQSQPLMQYDCRDRTRTFLEGPQKGHAETFAPPDVGTLVCQLVNR